MVRMTMFCITVIFTNGLDGEQLFTYSLIVVFQLRRQKIHLDLVVTCLSIM